MDNNIVNMPGVTENNETPDETKEVNTQNAEKLNDRFFGSLSMSQIEGMVSSSRDRVKMMEQNWTLTQKEFKLNDEIMKNIYDYNQRHVEAPPDDITEEERSNWDFLNGLNDMPDDAIFEIFGKEHPIYGVTMDVTRDRIKTSMQDFLDFLCAMREFKQIDAAYGVLIEDQEDKEINELKLIMEAETDPDKKANMKSIIDGYYYTKNIGFIAEPLPEEEINSTIKAFYDSKKIEYYIARAQEKLDQIKVSKGIILELGQFEKRFLEEKYHKLSCLLLLRFLRYVIFNNIKSDVPSQEKTNIVAFVMAIDGVARNAVPEARKQIILNNILAFEDQFVDRIEERNTNK